MSKVEVDDMPMTISLKEWLNLKAKHQLLREALEKIDIIGNGISNEPMTVYAERMYCGKIARDALNKLGVLGNG